MTITRQLTLIIAGCVLASCLAVGAGSYMVARKTLKKEEAQALTAMLDKQAHNVEDYLNSIRSDLIAQGKNPSVATAIRKYSAA
jgi:sensor domain CHASE-containing protein